MFAHCENICVFPWRPGGTVPPPRLLGASRAEGRAATGRGRSRRSWAGSSEQRRALGGRQHQAGSPSLCARLRAGSAGERVDTRLEGHRNRTGLCSGPQHTFGVRGLAQEEQGWWRWRRWLHAPGKWSSSVPRGVLPLSAAFSRIPRERQHGAVPARSRARRRSAEPRSSRAPRAGLRVSSGGGHACGEFVRPQEAARKKEQ